MSKIQTLGKKHGVHLVRQWILDGAGPARYGYGRVAPCKIVWLGRTLADAERVLSGEG